MILLQPSVFLAGLCRCEGMLTCLLLFHEICSNVQPSNWLGLNFFRPKFRPGKMSELVESFVVRDPLWTLVKVIQVIVQFSWVLDLYCVVCILGFYICILYILFGFKPRMADIKVFASWGFAFLARAIKTRLWPVTGSLPVPVVYVNKLCSKI